MAGEAQGWREIADGPDVTECDQAPGRCRAGRICPTPGFGRATSQAKEPGFTGGPGVAAEANIGGRPSRRQVHFPRFGRVPGSRANGTEVPFSSPLKTPDRHHHHYYSCTRQSRRESLWICPPSIQRTGQQSPSCRDRSVSEGSPSLTLSAGASLSIDSFM
jgi:hypothetical protein